MTRSHHDKQKKWEMWALSLAGICSTVCVLLRKALYTEIDWHHLFPCVFPLISWDTNWTWPGWKLCCNIPVMQKPVKLRWMSRVILNLQLAKAHYIHQPDCVPTEQPWEEAEAVTMFALTWQQVIRGKQKATGTLADTDTAEHVCLS